MRILARLVLASLLAGLLHATAVAEPKHGGTLVYGVTGEPPSTDCHAITTYAAVHVLAPHYSLLLKVDQDNYPKLKPDLAESWNVSADGLTYTFKIRSGALFHDGSPVSSKDIKATFDRLRAPPKGIVSIRPFQYGSVFPRALATPPPWDRVLVNRHRPQGASGCCSGPQKFVRLAPPRSAADRPSSSAPAIAESLLLAAGAPNSANQIGSGVRARSQLRTAVTFPAITCGSAMMPASRVSVLMSSVTNWLPTLWAKRQGRLRAAPTQRTP